MSEWKYFDFECSKHETVKAVAKLSVRASSQEEADRVFAYLISEASGDVEKLVKAFGDHWSVNERQTHGIAFTDERFTKREIYPPAPKTLTWDLAKVLVRLHADKDLHLNRFERIAEECIEVLAEHRGGILSLPLKELSEDAAELLGRRGGALYLNDLKMLSIEAARALAAHDHILHLNGLEEVPPDVAGELSRHRGWTVIEGDGWNWERIRAGRKLGSLSLNRVKALSLEAAKAFGQHWGALKLDGLERLDDDSAEALMGKHGEFVYLSGLKEVSPRVAKALVEHVSKFNTLARNTHFGECPMINLSKVETLSVEAADVLSGFEGPVRLDGLKSITREIARMFVERQRDFYLLGLTSFPEHTDEIFDEVLGSGFAVYLNQKVQAAKENEIYRLDVKLKRLTPEIAHFLTSKDWSLSLPRLEELTMEEAEGFDGFDGAEVRLGVRHLRPEVAKFLAGQYMNYEFVHVDNMTVEAARALATKNDPELYLSFDRVANIPDEIMEELAASNSGLTFVGLKHLSDRAAIALSKHTGSLLLGAPQMSDAAADALAKHTDISIALEKRGELSPYARSVLCQDENRPV